MTDSDSLRNPSEPITDPAPGDPAVVTQPVPSEPDRAVPVMPIAPASKARTWAPAHLARVRARRLRRLGMAVCLLLPGIATLVADILRRPKRVFGFDASHATGYWLTTLLLVILWGALLAAAAKRTGRARQVAAGVFVVLLGLAAGVQHAFFWRYNVYAGFDSAIYSASFPTTLVAAFPQGTAGTLLIVGATVTLALSLVSLARLFARPRRRLRQVAQPVSAALVLLVFGIPVSYRASVQSSPPELIYFHTLARYALERLECVAIPQKPTLVRVQRRFPEAMPTLHASLAAPRNILFILQESERFDAVCNGYVKDCDKPGRSSNEIVRGRFPFDEMRSAASSTAIAISNLWSGIDPTSTYEEMHTAPLLWDYAHAAGYDTAYWTSQNVLFGNARLYVQDLPLGHFTTGTDIDPKCDTLIGAKDAALSDYAIRHWDELKEPFFAVVHYSNLHRPRHVEKDESPYQPSADKHTRKVEGQNHYKNAVYLSDIAVAKLLEHVRGTPAGQRTVVVYTSDHAEAMYEHKNENDHSATVFDEEIHVPAWIDGPEGTLSPAEKLSLASKRNKYLMQYDIAATVLDLLGVWDAPEIAEHRSRILGLPLTRPPTFEKPRPLTNVSWLWEYHLPNWGMMQGSLKVLAREDDPKYLCFDVAKDPGEAYNLGEDECPELVAAARERFKILPKDMVTHMRNRQDIWGPWPPRPAP
jgi:glucan phosphoethanolaminetransferase (alkaline phosphatase superfamily)